MFRYIVSRLLQMIPIVIAVSAIVFFMVSFSPGDPARLVLGMDAKPEQIASFNKENGLDKPVVVQHFNYMGHAVTGDLGKSYTTKQNVSDMIAVRVRATLILTIGALLFTYLLAIPLGVLLAVKQNTWFDNVYRVIALVMSSMPSFWLGLLLILLFSVMLGWLPSNGFSSPIYWILPLLCYCCGTWGDSSRYVRAMVLDTIRQDYVRTARAKGCTERNVLFKHALKNAMMPLITNIGFSIGTFFSGSVILEQIFGINGMGRMTLEALQEKDVPTIMAGVLIASIMIAVGNLAADLCYGIVDPRIRSLYAKPSRQLRREAKERGIA